MITQIGRGGWCSGGSQWGRGVGGGLLLAGEGREGEMGSVIGARGVYAHIRPIGYNFTSMLTAPAAALLTCDFDNYATAICDMSRAVGSGVGI